MASEQTTVRKKKLRNLAKEEHHHPILYRHQDCIPSIKLFQNCERQNSSSLKNSKDFGCHEKEQAKTDIKENIKLLNSKVKNDEKSEKSVRKAKLSPEQNSDTTANKEELSKSRRRRLRKRRLLVSLAPSLNSVKPSPSTENNLQSKPVPQPLTRPSSVVPLAHNTSTNKSSDPAKSSAKDSRKRPDKSVGSRIKSIKSKSLIESTNQSKAEIIKTLEEKTLSSLLQTLVPLTNSSPKKEKPPVPLFSFPEKRLSSGSPKVDKDGVFYFGETKHQLEKLSPGFSKYNTSPVQEKSEFPQKTELNINCYSANKLSNLENSVPTFKFSPVNNERLSSLATIKRNLYETETFVPAVKKDSNKRVFSVGSPDSKINESMSTGLKSLNPFQSLNLCKPAISSSSVSLQNNLELCATNFAEKIHGLNSTENTNILSSVIPVSKADSEASQIVIASNPVVMKPIEEKSSKTREEIKMEREAKKAAKLAAKTKHKPVELSKANVSSSDTSNLDSKVIPQNMKDIKLEKKDIKVGHETLVVCQPDKSNTSNDTNATSDKVAALSSASLIGATSNVNPSGESKGVDQDSSIKSKAELKAERRAKQEAQRAAKEVGKNVQQQPKEKIVKKECPKPSVIVPVEKKTEVVKTNIQPKPKLFSHLYQEKTHLTSKQLLSVKGLHPAILRLGVQYASRVVVGSNARCIALLHALKQMVNDYTTPTEKEFSRGLEEELGPVTEYLNQCRLLAVSMTNALRHIKRTLTQLPNNITDVEARRKICDVVDTYIHDQVDKAGEQIRNTVKQKIADGDVILTYGCSSLVYQILVESHQRGTKFRVVVVDGLPWREGREMLRKLVNKGLSCTYVLITAASFIMREASKVLLGAHALLANGYVMSRAGSSQVALLAHCYNVPVLVCCETHKFCERVQTDAFVYNELGELCYDNIKESKDKTRAPTSLTPLSLAYDVTPPDLVSAVVTEVAVLPCTSVPVILRIKPSESAM